VVYVYVGDIGGRTYDNKGLNANIGLVVTSAGAVLINTGDQDHRWPEP
jgi:hypothetical protein